MNKNILLLIAFFFLCITTFGQVSNGKTIFVVDSIPVIGIPEHFNEVLLEDIAYISVIKNRDSLKILGLAQFDSVTYILTKEYCNRPDSIKKIPSLKQMEIIDSVWNLHKMPYSGKYIDYYLNGGKQDEGELLNGKLNGTLNIYFQNGNLISESHYINGMEDGIKYEYYKNGAVRQKREYKAGRQMGVFETYFINGQLESNYSLDKNKQMDTSITYYSTGKIKSIRIAKNGRIVVDPVKDDINYYESKFNQSIWNHDIKQAAKYCAKLFKIDSTNADVYFKRGLVLYWQYRFDEAITEFDKALKIEPLMRESLVKRGIARLKKYQFIGTEKFAESHKLGLLYAWVTTPIPNDEQEKVCSDLRLADDWDDSRDMIFVKAISFYCGKK